MLVTSVVTTQGAPSRQLEKDGEKFTHETTAGLSFLAVGRHRNVELRQAREVLHLRSVVIKSLVRSSRPHSSSWI